MEADCDGPRAAVVETRKDYTRKNVRRTYASLDDFLRFWRQGEKTATLEEQAVPCASAHLRITMLLAACKVPASRR